MRSNSTWTVARQVSFFAPADMGGKWHAARLVSNVPVCGAAVELGAEFIATQQGQESTRVHPLVCRRCLRLTTPPGVSGGGLRS